MKNIRGVAVAAVMSALVAGCGGTGRVATPAAVAVPAADAAAAINELLLRGEVRAAQKRIRAALKRVPNDAAVQLLRDSIARDPVELLGPDSFEHVVRPGETIPGLAQKYLGNSLKAYQLGRYNRLSPPFALQAGQTLRIPGEAPRAQPVRRPPEAPRAAPPRPGTPAKSANPAAPPPARPPVAPPRSAANPDAARKLRMAGLAALNQGRVAQAVVLLQRAAAADPANPVIARDLARARRIAATVQARR